MSSITAKAGGGIVPVVAACAVVGVSSWVLWRRLKTRVIGRIQVEDLLIYPIKSCAEQSVDTATPTPRGFEGDRMLQVVDANGKYCTPRDKDKSKLFQIKAELWGNKIILKSPNVDDADGDLEIDLDDKSKTQEV